MSMTILSLPFPGGDRYSYYRSFAA